MADSAQKDKTQPFEIPHPNTPGAATAVGLQLLKHGWAIIPINGATKLPRGMGWQYAGDRMAFMRDHYIEGDSIGIVAGQPAGFSMERGPLFSGSLDVDFIDEAASVAVRAILAKLAIRNGRKPKFLVHGRFTVDEGYSHDIKWTRADETLSMQVLGRSRNPARGPKQNVVWGWHKVAGKAYEWGADAEGLTIFDYGPAELPLIDLEALLGEMDGALEPLGWLRKAKAAGGPQGDPDDALGVMTEDEQAHMAGWARALVASTGVRLKGMGEKTGRGGVAYELAIKIAPVVGAGLLSADEVAETLAESVDWAAVEHDFNNGLNAAVDMKVNWSVAELAKFRGPNWEEAAKAQGVDWEAMKAGAQANAEGFKAEDRDAAKDIYRRPLIVAVCDILHDAMRERDAESRTAGEEIARGFMASQLAAAMATNDELEAEWKIRAARLNATSDKKYNADALAAQEAIHKLQGTEPGWALHAAQLMAEGFSAHAAIRQAQFSHNAEEPKTGEGWAIEVLKAVPTSWDRDGADIRNEKSSNLAHFLAVKLGVWPLFDDFQQRVIFRRLFVGKHVSDKELAVWNERTGTAVAAVYTKATNSRMPWGNDHYAPKKADVDTWLRDFAKAHSFNSAIETLDAWVAWDGQERLKDWLPRYLGYTHADAGWKRVALTGEHFMRGFVARAWQPGVKFDALMILIGLQGAAKTTMFKSLCDVVAKGSYAEDVNLKFDKSAGHNRVAQAMTGKLLGELAELRNMRGHDTEELKGLLSAAGDTGRDIGGADTFSTLRQFALVGTVNPVVKGMTGGQITVMLAGMTPWLRPAKIRELLESADKGFLQDPTGNRRMMPVEVCCEEIDRVGLAAEAPQLIAEAQAQLKGLGLKQLGPDFEVVMSPELRVQLGAVDGEYMAAGDMVQRLRDELATLLDGSLIGVPLLDGLPVDCIIVLKDMREWMDLRTADERSKLQTAFERVGFKQMVGAHRAVWYVRGDKFNAQHVSAVREKGGVTGWRLGKMFGEVGRDRGAFHPGAAE